MVPRPACCWHPISKYFPWPFSTHLYLLMTWVLKSVLQTLEIAFPFDKMNSSQQPPLFCLVFTQLCYYFQRVLTGPAWNACPRLSVRTQSAPTKGKEGPTFPRKTHTGLGTHTHLAPRRFLIFSCTPTNRLRLHSSIGIRNYPKLKNNPSKHKWPSPRPQSVFATDRADQT